MESDTELIQNGIPERISVELSPHDGALHPALRKDSG